ncbi:hypothetical protein BDZ85DRAFT_267866 [Elsinoe ampelina]|uniref:Uncharacterized protein n=1 Tax=Elsinoe ampelina TaxID=302913 RepID=A0A6A6G3E2_9PEZI|nr:hypothetical protein BDZ85DRAFT_267866 [Elsinoe ampelina]
MKFLLECLFLMFLCNIIVDSELSTNVGADKRETIKTIKPGTELQTGICPPPCLGLGIDMSPPRIPQLPYCVFLVSATFFKKNC